MHITSHMEHECKAINERDIDFTHQTIIQSSKNSNETVITPPKEKTFTPPQHESSSKGSAMTSIIPTYHLKAYNMQYIQGARHSYFVLNGSNPPKTTEGASLTYFLKILTPVHCVQFLQPHLLDTKTRHQPL